jgi:hypothetical protein
MIKPNIIEAKFLRSSNQGEHTKLWKDAGTQTKDIIRTQIDFLEEEVAILFYLEVENYWWLLSNKRLLIHEASQTCKYDLTDMTNAEMKDLYEDKVSKTECASIQLTINGIIISLLLEKRTWPIAATILQFIARKNKSIVV